MLRLAVSLLLASSLVGSPVLLRVDTIAFDAASHNVQPVGSTSVSVSHTVTGSNTVLFACSLSGTGNTPITATYNSVSMTSLGSTDNSGYHTETFMLINPSTGTHTLQVSLGTGTNIADVAAASYTGVAQTGTPENTATNFTETDDKQTVTETTVADNAWIVACYGGSPAANPSIDVGLGNRGTLRAADHGSFDNIGIFDNGPKTPAGAISIDISYGGTSFAGLTSFTMAPAGGGGAAFPAAITHAAPMKGGGIIK